MQRWQREFIIVTSLVLPALIASYFIGHLNDMLLIITSGLLIRQSQSINELEKWLSRGFLAHYLIVQI